MPAQALHRPADPRRAASAGQPRWRDAVPVLVTALAAASAAWLSLVPAVACAADAQPAAVAPAAGAGVETVAVQAGGSSTGFELDGQLQAVKAATVAAQTPGNVLALLVKAGDRVRAGQLLARVDDRNSAAGLAQSEAGVTQAETLARLARIQTERQRSLRAQGFVSQAALDEAEAQLKAAEAGLAQAEAGRSQAALAKGYAQVLAPFDGVVQATLVEAGDLAGPGRPLLTLYAPGALRAVVQVPASQAAALRAPGRLAALRVGIAGGPEGSVRWLSPVRRELLPLADPVSQTVELRLDLASADTRELMPGLAIRVVADGGARSSAGPATLASGAAAAGAGLRLPAGAVLQRGEITAVYVATGAAFSLRQVRVAPGQGEVLTVLAGLRAGERVAVDAVKAGLTGARPR